MAQNSTSVSVGAASSNQAAVAPQVRGGAALLRWAVALLLLCPSSGCVGLAAQLMYWAQGGHKIAAEFEGLEGKRVAVVCVSTDASYGPNSVSSMLSRTVSRLLEEKVDKIDVVHQDEVAEWIDQNGWNQMDYREIGRGVEAERVVALDVDGLRLYDGRTLYKGRADVTVSVLDMEDGGQVVFRRTIPEYTFPRSGARHTTEMSEAKFRALFVQVLAQHIARYFCRYNLEEEFATDAMSLGS